MARFPRFCPKGHPQHIIQRGNNRQPCFAMYDDYASYACWLKKYAFQFGVDIHAWVFMTNHVHLLATPRTDEAISYVAIMAGVGGSMARMHSPGSAAHRYGNQGRIVVFTLGGGKVPLRPELIHQQEGMPVPPITRRGTLEQRDQGHDLFQRNCSKCHLHTGEGGLPDLRKMNKQTHVEFMDIVLKGIRANRGMGSFAGQLSPEQVETIHIYLIDQAWKAYETEHRPQDPHQPDTAH
ncbi:c-type cytochrome [Porticoccaceae bacterium]|nr:c-type cytochrome [Porticoccaceae bacterium]